VRESRLFCDDFGASVEAGASCQLPVPLCKSRLITLSPAGGGDLSDTLIKDRLVDYTQFPLGRLQGQYLMSRPSVVHISLPKGHTSSRYMLPRVL
jgi:hypothetical protein